MAARMQRMRLRRGENEAANDQTAADAAVVTPSRGFAQTLTAARQALQPADLRMSGSRDRDEQRADQAAAGGGRLAPQLQVPDAAEASTAVPQAVAAELRRNQGAGRLLDADAAPAADQPPVRIHTDERADRLSRSLDAQAFTHGRDIYFARGAYQPQTTAGRQLIHHELHHAAGQAQTAAPMIQRKLSITRGSLIAATGDKGAMVWSTSSYEKLLDILKAYEKLDAGDPAGERADKRSELLLQIMNLAKAWLMSERRAFNDPTGGVKARKGDDIKRDMLGDLLVEAQDEYRKYLLGIEKPAKAEPSGGTDSTTPEKSAEPSTEEDTATEPAAIAAAVKQEAQEQPPAAAEPEQGAAPGGGRPRSNAVTSREEAGAPALPTRGRRGAIMLSETSAAEQAARQRAAEAVKVQKGFFARVGSSIGTFLHYTFGTDFTQQKGNAAFDPKRTLSPSVIDTLIRLMDQADKNFDELVTAGVKPAVALLLAYQEMPEQLRPKGTDPAARLALNVRKQYMLEAIKPAESRGVVDTVSDVNQTAGELLGLGKMVAGAGGAAVSAVGKATKAAAPGAGAGVAAAVHGLGAGVEAAGGRGAAAVGGVLGNQLGSEAGDLLRAGASKISSAGAVISRGSDHIGVVKAGSDALSGLIGGIRDTRDFISSVVAIFKAKDPQDKQIQTNAVLGVGLNLLANLSKLSSNVGKIVATFGSELPGVKLIASALQGLNALINQLKTAVRSLREMSLALEARRKESGLAHIIESLSNRNMMLMFRNAIKVMTNSIKMIGETLVLVPDPSGATQAAGKVTSIVASAVEAAATVGAMIEDSYRAGVAQEAAQQAMAGERGADVKVLQNNSAWAVTALILEAKKQPPDPIAVRELGNYGVTPERIARESLERLRMFVLAEIAEFPEPKTITQKLLGLARSIKGGAEGAVRGIGRAGAKVRDRFS